jgi:hypothetical protein
VLFESRLLAAVIVPFLVIAWAILYLQPERTEQLFAWPVRPTMTAMTLGAAYIGGAYFFVRVLLARVWEHVAQGFLPVAGFATLLGVTTILHWDRFTPGHVAFTVWAVLYFTTPVLVLLVWWRNRRAPWARTPEADERVLSMRARLVAGALGGGAVVLGVLLFLVPQPMMAIWPWTLTPLTARVLAAVCMLGAAGLGIARDARWTSVRLLAHVAAIMVGLIALATARAWAGLDPTNLLTWVFVGWLAAVLGGLTTLFLQMRHPDRPLQPALR